MQNTATKNRIDALLNAKHLPHTIIIEGDGDKKMSLALYVAKAFLCEELPTGCNNCKGCHLADIGTHPDIAVLKPKGVNYMVDQFKELTNEIVLSPFMANGRVFIISEAEKLNEKCQNTLLKTLEEPPKNVVFILVSSNTANLLPTVKSRAVSFCYDGSTEEQNQGLKDLAKTIISLAEEGKRYEILKLLNTLNGRAELDIMVSLIKENALNILKNKQNGVVTNFSDNRLNAMIINLSELKKKLVLNPPLKLTYALICDYITSNY